MRWRTLLVAVLGSWIAAGVPARADGPPDKSAEAAWTWAKQRFHAGLVADMNVFCGAKVGAPSAEPDPGKPTKPGTYHDAGWAAPCRQIDPARLRAVISASDAGDDMPHGIRLKFAHIAGDLELEDAHVRAAEVWIDSSLIDGDVDVIHAHTDGLLSLDGTTIGGSLLGSGGHFNATVDARQAVIRGRVQFWDARFEDTLSVAGAEFDGDVSFSGTRFGNDLFMDQTRFGGNLDLTGVDVHGQFGMDEASFAAPADAGAKNAGKDAPKPHQFTAEHLAVGSSLLIRHTNLPAYVNLLYAHVDGSADFRGSTVTAMTLVGAKIGEDLRLAGEGVRVRWTRAPGGQQSLDLRNAHVANLQDDSQAWPMRGAVDMEGFTFDHLGGFGVTQEQDPLSRGMDWWHDWFMLNPDPTPQPYTQLAAVLLARGDRDRSATSLFYGRDRERQAEGALCRAQIAQTSSHLAQMFGHSAAAAASAAPRTAEAEPALTASPCREWVKQSLLQWMVGYGIGDYTFRALWWIIGLALVGTVILAFSPGVRGTHYTWHARRGPRRKSLVWCFGASLSHILPVVSLSPEFTDFFNDPERKRLHPWQQLLFAALVVMGWMLGLFVLAAFSGITQK